MAGLLFIFILIVALFVLLLHGTNLEHLEQLGGVQARGDEFQGQLERYQQATNSTRNLLNRLQGDLRKNHGLKVEVLPELGLLRIPEAIVAFPSGAADFEKDSTPQVKAIAQTLANVLPCFSRSNKRRKGQSKRCQELNKPYILLEAAYVEGHTDIEPLIRGSYFENNMALSAARAQKTFEFMARCSEGGEFKWKRKGEEALTEECDQPDKSSVALKSLKNKQKESLFGVSGYGKSRPHRKDVSYRDRLTEQGMEKDRRIDLRFIMAPPEQASFTTRGKPAARE